MPWLKCLTIMTSFSLFMGTIMSYAAEKEPVETDARLHSNGNGWKLEQAKISDPTLPRVLLIGDSILAGYKSCVIKGLNGKAYVDTWVQPYNQGHLTGTYLTNMIKEVLAHGPYKIIVFNMGLHGFQKGRIPDGQFIPLTQKLIDVLRANAGSAQLIWLSTTPVTLKDPRPKSERFDPTGKPVGVDPEINPVIVEHNRMAAEVMKKEKIPILDLYSLLQPHLNLALGDSFHWTKPAYAIMGEAIVGTIIKDL